MQPSIGAGDRPRIWVGRREEWAALDSALDALSRFEGAVAWVEGEPGIGKSSLVAKAMERAGDIGCQVLCGTADQLSQRFPLRVMLDCLQVRPHSPDKRRAAIADFLRDVRPGLLAVEDATYAAAEMLIGLVDELCTASPTVMVIDDLQWADEASLTVWHRLALLADQLPLLLIGTCRPVPRQREVQVLRETVSRRGGILISLGALNDNEVAALVTSMVGVPPGPALTRLVAQAMGNPLYVGELVDALIRERIGLADAELSEVALEHLPESFTAALNGRLSFVPAGTVEMLRAATLLGAEFTVTDLAVVLRRSASELVNGLQDALAAGIVVGVGSQLAFRHPLIRQALYDSMPAALRNALHREAAQALAAATAEPLRVAQQLLAAGQPGDRWTHDWLVEAAPALAARAPCIAKELLERELDQALADHGGRDVLTAALARTLLGMGQHADAAARACQALVVADEPERRADMYWVLARAQLSTGRNDEAVDTLEQALGQPELPGAWRARLLASLAMVQRAGAGDLDAADATAHEALRVGKEAADTFAIAYALTDLWLNHAVRRDHAAALDCADQALAVLGDGPGHIDLRAFALDARIFTLQNLDRWQDAEAALRTARQRARQHSPERVTSGLTAAVLLYWLGRWDDGLAELDALDQDESLITYSGLRERGPALLRHGVAALIAARRGDNATAADHLRAGLAIPVLTTSDRENSDFLLAARAIAAEQAGNPRQALSALSPILRRQAGEMTLIHQWLPDLVRLAMAVDDRPTALAALQACQSEAVAESVPARATAASRRCRGLSECDPALLDETVAHYRAVGPAVELACALEDLAAVLAERGQVGKAKNALDEAVDLYGNLGAVWDSRRAESRLRPYGIRRGVRGRRAKRAAFGWEALTPTERKVATLVAEGQSTPDIAQNMFLSRRTVQTHISHIMSKLGVRGRVEIAREVLGHAGESRVPQFVVRECQVNG